jgi:hypothetical protein
LRTAAEHQGTFFEPREAVCIHQGITNHMNCIVGGTRWASSGISMLEAGGQWWSPITLATVAICQTNPTANRQYPGAIPRWHTRMSKGHTGGSPSHRVRELDKGSPERFEHHYLREQRLYTDLFDHRHWRLIEAKVRADRVTLRTAVGQLFDYQRCYPGRHPALGVLLAERPRRSDVEYLRACNVTGIWKTSSGRFGDTSSDGRWSTPVR